MIHLFLLLIFYISNDTLVDANFPQSYQSCAYCFERIGFPLERPDTLAFEKEVLGKSLMELRQMDKQQFISYLKKLVIDKEINPIHTEIFKIKDPICQLFIEYARINHSKQFEQRFVNNVKSQHLGLPILKEGIRIWYLPSKWKNVEIIDLDLKKIQTTIRFYEGINIHKLVRYKNVTKLSPNAKVKLIKTELLIDDKKSLKKSIHFSELFTLRSQSVQLGHRLVVRDGYDILVEVFQNKKYNVVTYANPMGETSDYSFQDAHTFLKIWKHLTIQVDWKSWHRRKVQK